MAGPGRSLRVLERDGFFDDAFFKEAWDDFDRAMQNVLDRFDSTGLKSFRSFPSLSRRHTSTRSPPPPSPPPPPPPPQPQQVLSRSLPRQVGVGSRNQCRDVYSKIRSSKIDEDLYASQALQITEKDGKFQVVMDVKDFNPRELQVRAVDDRIVVEGSYQKVSEDGVSSSCKSFYKEFTLPPAADLDQVATALSRDGVLTIKAPRKDGTALTDAPRAPANTSTSSTSSSTQQQQFSDNSSNSSFKSTSSRKVIQSSSSFESSSDGFDSLPKEMREKLMFCDSGFGSTKTSTCSSPAPSEAGSESSRVSSTMEFDLSKRAPVKTEVAFNVSKPSQGPSPQQAPPQQVQPPQSPPNYPQSPPPQPQTPQQMYQQFPNQQYQQQQQFNQYNQFQQYEQPTAAQYPQSPPPQAHYQSPPPQYQSPPPQFPQSPPPQAQYQSPQPQFQPVQPQFPQFQPSQQYTPQQVAPQMVPQTIPATGTGNQTSVSVTEENGRRVVTSQCSNVVQEKDGFREHRETAAEITDKDSQAARKEASTKLSKVEEDPEGKFKRAESTDAAEVSESCIQHLPDGSVMSVKKNSTSSSSSFKQSFSSGISGGDIMGGFFPPPPNFPQGFDDFRSLMGRGHSLMSQMSTDSMGSTLSGRSGFSDMSNFSHFTDASSPFSDMSSFGNMSSFSSRSKNFQQQQQQQQQQQPQQQQPQQQQQQEFGSPRMKGFSTSSSSSTSSFNQTFSSNFGDGNF